MSVASDPDKNLNALTPSKSALKDPVDTETIRKFAGSKSAAYPKEAEVAAKFNVVLFAADAELIE